MIPNDLTNSINYRPIGPMLSLHGYGPVDMGVNIMYRIERTEYVYNADDEADVIDNGFLPGEFSDHKKAEQKIIGYAEAWRKESTLIQHHAGQSVVYFPWGYVEFSRSHDIQDIT